MSTNTDDIMARMETMRREQEEKLQARRVALLAILRAAGALRVTMTYDGYGDEGNVQDVTIEPETVALSTDDSEALESFGWDRAYALHPGFENNEGGYGELIWDIAADRICRCALIKENRG